MMSGMGTDGIMMIITFSFPLPDCFSLISVHTNY